jgi:HPt (histidine-containing phosphotransfer) domain-containing protein
LAASQNFAPHVDLSFFKVLAVTKDPKVRALFQNAQIPVKAVETEAEALQALDGERFDLVFLDFEAGGEAATATLKAIRGSDTHFRTVPILAAADDGFNQGLINNQGVQDMLAKPVEATAFTEQMQSWADRIFEALPVLQESSIDKIRMFDDEEQTLLNSLFQIYTESTGSELVEIKQLVQLRDFDMLRKKAHKLKSSAAQLGAFRFEKYCNLMEYDPSLTQARAQRLYEEMSSEYEKSLAEFNLYCQKHAGAPL